MNAAQRILATKVSKKDQMRFVQELITYIPELADKFEPGVFPLFRFEAGLGPKVIKSLKHLGWKLQKDVFTRNSEWPMEFKLHPANYAIDVPYYTLSVPTDDGVDPVAYVKIKAKQLLKVFQIQGTAAVRSYDCASANEASKEFSKQLRFFQSQGFKIVDSAKFGNPHINPYGGSTRGVSYVLVNKDWQIQVRNTFDRKYVVSVWLEYIPQRTR